MKQQVFNPYLPSWEYIPDAEPRVFGDRVYIYGSHDRFNAPMFCMNDYVCWSAAAEDLSDWRYEGVIYRKNQDPRNRMGIRLLFAPDVVQGRDGKYYLYYALDFTGLMSVAVCDTPAGRYQFLRYVRHSDGVLWGRKNGDQFPFDPGVLVDDDGKVWLYAGFYKHIPSIATGFKKLKNDGGAVVELENDMLTMKTEPKVVFPKQGPGSFENHEFFEASSIWKDGGQYVFVYSSRHNHELCYATSKRPDGGFVFGGTLVSQEDLFLNGRESEKEGVNYLGNTHGGLLNIGKDWYIFYHRQTNRHSYSRQACAQKLEHISEGKFRQAEVTSCGLNGEALAGLGEYPAYIACNLWSKDGVGRYDGKHPGKTLKAHPYFTQSGKDREENGDQYIANMQDGAVAGFKYFRMGQADWIGMEIRGTGNGRIEVSDEPDFGNVCAGISVTQQKTWEWTYTTFCCTAGVKALYFRFRGTGQTAFRTFRLEQKEKEGDKV